MNPFPPKTQGNSRMQRFVSYSESDLAQCMHELSMRQKGMRGGRLVDLLRKKSPLSTSGEEFDAAPAARSTPMIRLSSLFSNSEDSESGCRDENVHGLPRSVHSQLPTNPTLQGFLEMRRKRFIGFQWVRVWCVLGRGVVHLVQNVPLQHHILQLDDFEIEAVGSNEKFPVFALRPTEKGRTEGAMRKCTQERYTFKATGSNLRRSHWLRALQSAKLSHQDLLSRTSTCPADRDQVRPL